MLICTIPPHPFTLQLRETVVLASSINCFVCVVFYLNRSVLFSDHVSPTLILLLFTTFAHAQLEHSEVFNSWSQNIELTTGN